MSQSPDLTQNYVSLSLDDCTIPMQILQIKPNNINNSDKVIIVIQEIFGINESLRQTCLNYAKQGYTILCPDLFHRLKAGVNLMDSNPDDLQQAFTYFNNFNIDTGIHDIAQVIDYAKNTLNAKKIGAVGYCLGGFLAYLTACRCQIDACVSYYGVNIQNHLNEADKIQKPLILHIAQNDEFVPLDAQETILNHFKNNNLVQCQYYHNAHHAFARINGIHYNAEAAIIANQVTEKFFKQYLI